MNASAATFIGTCLHGERIHIDALYDRPTGTISYILLDRHTRHCALIDTVLDYDASAGRTSHSAADTIIARVRELGAQVRWILETHVHADHLSAAPYLKATLGGQTGIGVRIATVQRTFARLFNTGDDFRPDGSQFDHLFNDHESFEIGSLRVRALQTPGHTPACVSYLVSEGDNQGERISAAFVGDTLFMPDSGTARCDFPGGDARQLFRSIQDLLALPPDTVLYTGHDYQPGGRELGFATTVAEQLACNIHLRAGMTEDAFVAMRQQRDACLAMPSLILPAVQVNMRGGHLPDPESSGQRFLKIPVDAI